MSLFGGPSVDWLRRRSEQLNYSATEEELNIYKALIHHSLEDYAALWNMNEEVEGLEFPRGPAFRPQPQDNPLNAWYYKCGIGGAEEGVLAGKTVAIKDNVFVAGVPLMNGSRALEGFVPTSDATIVKRILRCGGKILGKATCEDLCLSGGSYVTTYGPVRNPWAKAHSAGGSSSGSAALVANKDVDVAIGGDQGGSIRIPASCCGIVGLKPTWGLVPYTGIVPIETSLDHAGPMARTVEDCAALLEAVAGFDEHRDGRQPSTGFVCPRYTQDLKAPLDNIKVGILREGFDGCEEEVVTAVKTAIVAMKESGAFTSFQEVSIPMHSEGGHIWSAIGIQGVGDQMIGGAAAGIATSGAQSWQLSEKLWQGLRSTGPSLSHNVKFINLMAAFVQEQYGPAVYAKGQKMALALRKKYDEALSKVDVLLMPTLPQLPCSLPSKETTLDEAIGNSLAPIKNTAPFDFTHHPAITVNAGFAGKAGLPVGLMLVGRGWEDSQLLRVAKAAEAALAKLQTRHL